MTASVTLGAALAEPGGSVTATHRLLATGRLARAGDSGTVELWGLGRWLQTDHPNWMLDARQSHWFARLAG